VGWNVRWGIVGAVVVVAACSNELEPLLRGHEDDHVLDDTAPPHPKPQPEDPPEDPPAQPEDPPPPEDPPASENPPAPVDDGDTFDTARPLACGQNLTETVTAAAPRWYRVDTTGQTVTLTLDGNAPADLDLHVTSGPNIPADVITVSESPTAHEEARVTDRGVVGVRVMLYGGAESASYTLRVDCATTPPPVAPPSDLQCITYTALNTRNVQGTALRDIVRHLPNNQVDYYCDPDKVTCAHEVSHGIHAHLRNNYNPNNQRSNAFYILQDRACFVVEPNIRKSAAAPYVPNALREFRFGTYVTGQSAWDDTPLYLWDEWNAYINGGEAAISLYDEGLWTDGWRDQSGVIEFVAYGLAVGMAVEERDPTYFNNNAQFKAMMGYLLRRSLELHRRFAALTDFRSQTSDRLYNELRTGASASAMRDFIRRTWGQAFLNEVLAL
jgi:hypothetical protein